MAVTISIYNHTAKLFANGEVSLSDLTFMLLDNSGTFDATDTDISDVSTNQVSGSGWTAGGEAIANAAVTVTTTNDATLDGDDIEVTATGGPIGPAYYGVIYDSDSGNLLFHVNFDGAKQADSGTPFKVVWHSNGIATWTVT